MKLDDKVCYCFHISKRKIINHLRIHRPRRASQLSDCGGAGTGCGWCVPYLKRYFAEYEKSDLSEAGELSSNETEVISAEEYARQRDQYIESGKGKPPAR
ncbi:(2Fe-2S)-binding protein [Gimesia algae]|uniref:BFD-like [2Fe-2S] binding domain protein n=1 Tax=Gimesia algae TaxID=2527971 RepID=A0A517VLX8_9PLAN|nr:(2Fe-2S)-binding protein [Gimesia algae]QDT94031.1 BFD-like [2Fe-2S] binding domain protein [Gimesia algae]